MLSLLESHGACDPCARATVRASDRQRQAVTRQVAGHVETPRPRYPRRPSENERVMRGKLRLCSLCGVTNLGKRRAILGCYIVLMRHTPVAAAWFVNQTLQSIVEKALGPLEGVPKVLILY